MEDFIQEVEDFELIDKKRETYVNYNVNRLTLTDLNDDSNPWNTEIRNYNELTSIRNTVPAFSKYSTDRGSRVEY